MRRWDEEDGAPGLTYALVRFVGTRMHSLVVWRGNMLNTIPLVIFVVDFCG